MMKVVTSEWGNAQQRRPPQGVRRWLARPGGLLGSLNQVKTAVASSVALYH